MSKQWNQVSSITKEFTLLEVMSEEFNKRLHTDEDFVWVDIPEAVQKVSNMTHFEVKAEEQFASDTYSDLTNVVQPVTHDAGLEDKCSDQSDYDDIMSENEEIIETEYVNQCMNHKVKGTNPCTTKYPKLRTKIRGHSNLKSEKRQFSKENNGKCDSKEQINELLPKMKFDVSTTAILEMLIKNRYLGQYNELVGKGTNSVVFHAHCHRRNCITMPFVNAVKIYKTSKDEEKNKVIYRKVQREFEHLSMMNGNKGGWNSLFAPSPIRAWKNVIVMQFIGYYYNIQDAPPEGDEKLYNVIISFMDKLYNIKQLVHGKLSACNILCWEVPCFIGWSHSVKRDHPLALTKLIKDCHFVTEFYKRRGVNVMPLEDLFQKITDQKPSEKLLEVVHGKDLYKSNNPNRSESLAKTPTSNRFKY